MWLFCYINWMEIKKKKNKQNEKHCPSKEMQRKIQKQFYWTAISRFTMCQINAYCTLQCPRTVWVMWIAYRGVSDVNFNSSALTWNSIHVYPPRNHTYLFWGNWREHIFHRAALYPRSPTIQLTCSAPKGHQSSNCYFAWVSGWGIQLQESTISTERLFRAAFRVEGTCCILESNT